MNNQKKGRPFLALGAGIVGVGSILVTTFASIGAGLAMMLLPLWMIYKAG